MFSLGVIEHLQLNCGLVVQNYTAHAKAAERLATLAFRVKMAIVILSALATGSIVLALIRPGRQYLIAAAIISALALAAHVATVAYGLEARVHSHRLLAHRLWLMCERHRELLTEIQDGLVDNPTILHRRELLSAQVHATYEQGFPVDETAFESLRQKPLDEGGQPAVASVQADPVIPARKAGGSVQSIKRDGRERPEEPYDSPLGSGITRR
jgi:hypothetical protein